MSLLLTTDCSLPTIQYLPVESVGGEGGGDICRYHVAERWGNGVKKDGGGNKRFGLKIALFELHNEKGGVNYPHQIPLFGTNAS